uniref:D-lactate dehydrogenase (cytochrome) n=1 Tax=uncultured Chloroflexota bacterium TaxID=166587 RepID=H5SN49_9CHLR|nr:glycolate oxidase [uncultured Chloroflexota bacterium]
MTLSWPLYTGPVEGWQLAKTVQILQEIVTPARVSATQADRAHHSRDQSSYPEHLPDLVVWPQTTAEVRAIVQHANEVRLPVTAWGAGTSLEGNPIPVYGGIVLDFSQMNRILAIHQADFQVTVQPGVLYKDMNQTLARYGLFFAPDPGANASIGGMIANNAAGIRTVKYGATRDNVLALEVVLANGQVIRTGSRSVKQSAGYDLTHLFVGSEGTLGLITEATLKLAPLPEHFSAVLAAFTTVAQAAQAVFEIIGAGLGPAALELLDAVTVEMIKEEGFELVSGPHLLMEFSGASQVSLQEELKLVEAICHAQGCGHYQAGVGREARHRLWRLRHQLFEIVVRHYPGQHYLITDVAVPISQYPTIVAFAAEKMAELAVEGIIVGHAGDGNMHTTIFFEPEDTARRTRIEQFNNLIVEQALALGGTSTGEHGVGLGKQKYMAREHGQVALEVMRQLKATLDPNGILNPGKVLG